MLKPDNKIFQAYSYINNGNLDAFKALIEEYPKLLQFKNQNNENMFLYSVKKDKVQFIDYLLEKDESLLNSVNKKNENAIMISAKNIATNSLDYLLFKKDIFNLLISYDENKVKSYSFVYKYGEQEQVFKVMRLLKEKKIKEGSDNNNQNPLHFLAYNEKIKNMDKIIKFYPEKFLSEKTHDTEFTPVMIAAANQNLKNFQNFYRDNNEKNSFDYSLLDFSAKNSDNSVFEFLYKKHKNDINESTIDRIVFDSNDKALSTIIDNHQINDINLEEITKKAHIFKKSVKSLLNKNTNLVISNIFINTTAEDLKFIFQNKTEYIKKYYFQNIQKTLINKKDFINKIIYIFDSLDTPLTDQDSLKFLTQIKKIPINQQIYLLSKKPIINKLSESYRNKVYELLLFRIDKEELISSISTTMLPLYMHGNEKNIAACEKIYQNSSKKAMFSLLLAKKIKSFEELDNHSYLSPLEIKDVKRNIISSYISNPDIEPPLDIPYSILKSAIEQSFIDRQPIINEKIIGQAINKKVVINFDYWFNLFMDDINISPNIHQILGKPKTVSIIDSIFDNNTKLNTVQYTNLIEVGNKNEDFSPKLIHHIIKNQNYDLLKSFKINEFSEYTQSNIIKYVTKFPINENIKNFLNINFDTNYLNDYFIENNLIDYLDTFNRKIKTSDLKKLNFSKINLNGEEQQNVFVSILNKLEKKSDIDFAISGILNSQSYVCTSILAKLDNKIFDGIDKNIKIQIVNVLFKDNILSSRENENNVFEKILNTNDKDIKSEINLYYDNLDNDKKIKFNFTMLEDKVNEKSSVTKKKIKI